MKICPLKKTENASGRLAFWSHKSQQSYTADPCRRYEISSRAAEHSERADLLDELLIRLSLEGMLCVACGGHLGISCLHQVAEWHVDIGSQIREWQDLYHEASDVKDELKMTKRRLKRDARRALTGVNIPRTPNRF